MTEEQDGGFVRQRRNLLIVSLVLLFSEISSLSIEKLNVLGNELSIGEPRAVSGALWILGVYWLWRFYTYSRPRVANAISGTIYHRVEEICLPTAIATVLRLHPHFRERFGELPDLEPKFEITNYTFYGQMRDYLDMEVEISKNAGTPTRAISQSLGKTRLRITGSELASLRIRAWIHMIIHTQQFSDYLLPYVLFYLPVVYAAYQFGRSLV